MKMVDKLYKNNHKKPYYIVKKIFLCAFVFSAISASIVVPTIIFNNIESNQKVNNSDTKESTNEKNNLNEIEADVK